MDRPKKIMPLVAQMLTQMDELFVEFVGPIGFELAEGVLALWLKEGKTGFSGLRRYVAGLSQYLDSPTDRQAFLAKSERLLLDFQTGLTR